MQRKQFGSVFIVFSLIHFFFGLITVISSDQYLTFGTLLTIYGGSLLLSGTMIMLFASNDEVELATRDYVIYLAVAAIIGGIITNFETVFTIGFGLMGMSFAPVVNFVRKF